MLVDEFLVPVQKVETLDIFALIQTTTVTTRLLNDVLANIMEMFVCRVILANSYLSFFLRDPAVRGFSCLYARYYAAVAYY